MNRKNIDTLLEQIRCIILNKDFDDKYRLDEKNELFDVQDGLYYLGDRIGETNDFLSHLSRGEINIPSPSKDNYMAGYLKDLQSNLKHLTWQANQIANGDYSQRVCFLGEFSIAFNYMVEQLQSRENKIMHQSEILKKTNTQMKAIMNTVSDWLIVTSEATGDILYKNYDESKLLSKYNSDDRMKDEYNKLLEFINSYDANASSNIREYSLNDGQQILEISTFPIYWDDSMAFVHHISDITTKKQILIQLKNNSYKDELTGLYNRRYIFEVLDKLIASNTPFSCVMIDLDYLKVANDKFGHSAGDEYLKTLAMQMQNVTRSTDSICRMGGDEFLMVLPDCSEAAAQKKADTINENFAKMDRPYPMSISYGIVEVKDPKNFTKSDIIGVADSRMYIQKQAQHKARTI